MVDRTTRPDRWLRRYGAGDSARLRLFCFHHAGGSATMYRDLPRYLPPSVAVEAVGLPGRDSRFRERPYDRMGPLVEAVVGVLRHRTDLPYALFGYSMGAQVSFHVAHALRDLDVPAPLGLFVAASPGPSLQCTVPGWNESDERLVAYLREMGRTSDRLLDNADLLDMMLPTVRADLTVVATRPYSRRRPLSMPVHAFSGDRDRAASRDLMAAWRRETAGPFRQTELPGGHFFIDTAMPQLASAIGRDLTGMLERCSGSMAGLAR